MQPSLLDVLKQRLVAGAISIEEFRALRAELEDAPPTTQQPSTEQISREEYGEIILSFDQTSLYRNVIAHAGRVRPLSEVSSVYTYQQYRSFNFVPTQNTSIGVILFESGERITFSEDRLFFGAKRHAAIQKLISTVQALTVQNRLNRLVKTLVKYCEITLYKASPGQGKSIYLVSNGLVVAGTLEIDLKEALAHGTFALGSGWRSLNGMSHSENPAEVIISMKKPTFGALIPRDALRFVPNKYDVDIVHSLLNWLSKPGNNLPS